MRMEQWAEDIILRLQMDKKTMDLDNYPGDSTGRFWRLEGINKNDGSDERCFIYDCSENDYEFDFGMYNSYMEKEEDVSRPIIIFKSWDCEQLIKKNILSDLKNASDKRKFLRYFERKESVYTDLMDNIELEVEENGVNYLDYRFSDSNDKIVGRVYNLSFAELKKVFNVTGTYLFRKNVRMGMKKNGGLKENFQEYVKVGAYNQWLQKYPDDKDNSQIKDIFEIEDLDLLVNLPGAFWFFHNGVTFFYYGKEEINFSGRLIKFNPREISVINGAQTIKNFFEGINELLDKLVSNCKEMVNNKDEQEELISFFEEYLQIVSTQIYVKAIFIAGEERYVQPITYGLNTQLPIIQAHIIADSDEVASINSWLKRGKMKILKEGEVASVGVGFSVLEFIKLYLIAKGKPGKSKNLNRGELVTHIKEVADLVGEEESNVSYKEELKRLLDDILDITVIEEWWKKNKNNREKVYSDKVDITYCNYGKSYFESYVLKEKQEEIDEEYLEILFNMFLEEFKELKPDPDIKDFKSDSLFDKYNNNRREKVVQTIQITREERDELKDYINETKQSFYSIHRGISKYLNERNIELGYFRVIARSGGKARESFAFPSSTFNELIQSIPENDKSIQKNVESIPKYKEYEESLFAKEIKKKFPVFVIDWKTQSDGTRVVENIEFISEISFKCYEQDAKIVYEETVQAFIDGNEDEFPKTKDNKFHIRPKGVNALDTFEFTNGVQITKRTFWANSTTIDELIDGRLSNHK